jgi:hypothetical protein
MGKEWNFPPLPQPPFDNKRWNRFHGLPKNIRGTRIPERARRKLISVGLYMQLIDRKASKQIG